MRKEVEVDPALVPFLDAVAEMLVAALLRDQAVTQPEAARSPADTVEVHLSTTPKRTSRRRSTARR